MEANWGLMGLLRAWGTYPSHQAPGRPAEREDNCGSSVWGCRSEVGGSSIICHWEAGKENIMATGSGWVPNKGWDPGLVPQQDTTTGSSTTMCYCHIEVGGSSITCCLGAWKNIVATGPGWVLNEGWAPGLEPQQDVVPPCASVTLKWVDLPSPAAWGLIRGTS